MTTNDTAKLQKVFPRLTGTRQRDGVLILMPVEFLTDEDIEAIAATMLKLAEEVKELKKERSKIFKEGYNQGLDAAKKVLAARKGDAGEKRNS